jgi:hypothetical protein
LLRSFRVILIVLIVLIILIILVILIILIVLVIRNGRLVWNLIRNIRNIAIVDNLSVKTKKNSQQSRKWRMLDPVAERPEASSAGEPAGPLKNGVEFVSGLLVDALRLAAAVATAHPLEDARDSRPVGSAKNLPAFDIKKERDHREKRLVSQIRSKNATESGEDPKNVVDHIDCAFADGFTGGTFFEVVEKAQKFGPLSR